MANTAARDGVGNTWDWPEGGRDFPRYLKTKVVPKLEELLRGYGPIAGVWFDVPGPITRAVLKGFLESAEGGDVNYVNAPSIAQQLGLHTEEIKSTDPIDYAELINVSVVADSQKASASGTFYGSPNNPRIVRINDMPVEAVPTGVLFIMRNQDRPGVVGWIGTVMGKHGVNIASMSLGRDKQGGTALVVLNLDSAPSLEALAEIRKDKDIVDVKIAKL
jgi:D-3-phosphoglycerate dehydrogenase